MIFLMKCTLLKCHSLLLGGLVLWLIGLSSSHVFADTSRLRIVGSGGMGNATVTSIEKGKSSEGPLSFSSTIDYMVNQRFGLGAEHIRSLGSNGTTIGLTGLNLKYYFLFQHPISLLDDLSLIEKPTLQIQAWSPYIGTSVGFAQASILETTINAVTIYFALKGGVDYPLSSLWGFRSEFNFAFTGAGTGNIQLVDALMGFYLNL